MHGVQPRRGEAAALARQLHLEVRVVRALGVHDQAYVGGVARDARKRPGRAPRPPTRAASPRRAFASVAWTAAPIRPAAGGDMHRQIVGHRAGQRGEQNGNARLGGDRDALAGVGLEGAVRAEEVDVGDGRGVVGVGQMDVVLTVLGRGRAGEPEVGVRRGAAGAEQRAADAAGDLGGLLGRPARGQQAVGRAGERGRVRAVGGRGDRLARLLQGEDGLGRRRACRSPSCPWRPCRVLARRWRARRRRRRRRRHRRGQRRRARLALRRALGRALGVNAVYVVWARSELLGAGHSRLVRSTGSRSGALAPVSAGPPGAVSEAKPVSAASATAPRARERVVRFTADSRRGGAAAAVGVLGCSGGYP